MQKYFLQIYFSEQYIIFFFCFVRLRHFSFKFSKLRINLCTKNKCPINSCKNILIVINSFRSKYFILRVCLVNKNKYLYSTFLWNNSKCSETLFCKNWDQCFSPLNFTREKLRGNSVTSRKTRQIQSL